MTSNTNLAEPRVAPNPAGMRAVSKFARPANTTAYAIGDVVFEEAAGVIQFDECGPSGIITGVEVLKEETSTASFTLLLFDQEPTNIADNATLASGLTAADLEHLVSVYTFTNATKVALVTGIESYDAVAHHNAAYTSDNGKLYGILVSGSVFTPASATAYTVKLHLRARA